jgi:hypothetical protein
VIATTSSPPHLVPIINMKDASDEDAKSTSSDEKGNICGNTFIF